MARKKFKMRSSVMQNTDLSKFPSHAIHQGSIVRTRMLGEVARIGSNKDGNVRIVDLGCGASSMWPKFLTFFPNAEYFGFDPSATAIKNGEQNLASFSNCSLKLARHNDPQIKQLYGTADIVVSHSVLEHVYERGSYFDVVAKLLAKDGVGLISWGSDHFKQGFRTDVRNILSEVLSWFKIDRYFAKRVDLGWAMAAIEEAGLEVECQGIFSHVPTKKLLRHVVDEAERIKIFQSWIDLEYRLNLNIADKALLDTYADETFVKLKLMSRNFE